MLLAWICTIISIFLKLTFEAQHNKNLSCLWTDWAVKLLFGHVWPLTIILLRKLSHFSLDLCLRQSHCVPPTSEPTGHFQPHSTVDCLEVLPRNRGRLVPVEGRTGRIRLWRERLASWPSQGDAVPAGAGDAAGDTVGRNLGYREHIPTATEASLLHLAVLLHYSELRFYLHLTGLCTEMNKPLHSCQIMNISVNFSTSFWLGQRYLLVLPPWRGLSLYLVR